MTWPAALPLAALRVLRTAAGRRALQVTLVVGGLFALGFLSGERAYAADGVSVGTGTSSVERLVTDAAKAAPAPGKPGPQAPADHPQAPAESATPQPPAPGTTATHPTDGTDDGSAEGAADTDGTHDTDSTDGTYDTADTDGTGDQVLRPVTDRVIQGVSDRVLAPARHVVESVTAGLAEAPPLSSLPTLPSLPVLPTAPESPAWPALPGFEIPGLPDAPGFPGAPTLPGVPGQTLPAPVTTTPRPGPEAPGADGIRDDEGRTGTAASGVYGPRFVAGAAAVDASAADDAHRVAPSGYAPVHEAPADHPSGVVGSRSAGDNNNTSRHGDAHAVSLSRRAPLRLVPGAAARTVADEIQDRHGDIPVSPA